MMVGIETERGPWVASLVAAGYTVYAINPLSSVFRRERPPRRPVSSRSHDPILCGEVRRRHPGQPISPCAGGKNYITAVSPDPDAQG